MGRHFLAGVLVIGLGVATAGNALAFDRKTVAALKACHDYLWFQVPEFEDLPNAAVSVYPGMTDGKSVVVNWHVVWDDPAVKRAGTCTVIGEEVAGYEDFTK